MLFRSEIHRLLIADYTSPKGAMALVATDAKGRTLCHLSANIPEEFPRLGPNQFFLRNWSEHAEAAEKLIERGILVETGESVQTGHVAAPIVTLAKEMCSDAFKCFGCSAPHHMKQAWRWPEVNELYCPNCRVALDDDAPEMSLE